MIQHLTWLHFEEDIVRSEGKHMHIACKSPYSAVFSDLGGKRIGALIEVEETEIPIELSRLANLEITAVELESRCHMQIVCVDQSLFREAYLLITATIDRVCAGEPIVDVLCGEISAMEALAGQQASLSIEKQIGLYGELLVLLNLTEHYGTGVVDSWTGPLRQAHDFRLSGLEFEVKTTSGSRRVHRIHGLRQALASPGHALYFVSITLARGGAGDGESLPALIRRIRDIFECEPSRLAKFHDALDSSGYIEKDEPVYGTTWIRSGEIQLIPVDGKFPALTSEVLESGSRVLMSRLERVDYEVNLEGLGEEWSSAIGCLPQATEQK